VFSFTVKIQIRIPEATQKTLDVAHHDRLNYPQNVVLVTVYLSVQMVAMRLVVRPVHVLRASL
jgi:hypothetical protein